MVTGNCSAMRRLAVGDDYKPMLLAVIYANQAVVGKISFDRGETAVPTRTTVTDRSRQPGGVYQ